MNNRHPRGKFIVIYGANNLGKTTQAQLLVKKISSLNIPVEYLKYPIYDLQPSGPKINEALRHDHSKLNDLELQKLFAKNRIDYQPTLNKKLSKGINLIVEDYKGTGIAWGIVNEISLNEMEQINKNLLEEDLAILIDGEHRFKDAIEENHRYETGRDWNKARYIHLQLAKKYNWKIVNGNQNQDQVHLRIWKVVKPLIEEKYQKE